MNGQSYRLKRSRENASSQAPEKPEDALRTVNAAPSYSFNVATLTDLLQTAMICQCHAGSGLTLLLTGSNAWGKCSSIGPNVEESQSDSHALWPCPIDPSTICNLYY